jgi:Spy/CpxP family protein refolding chaperone
MRAFFTATLALGLVGLLAGSAAAQGRGGFGMGGGGSYAMLLANESVQKELKLEDQQVEKCKEIGDKAREKMQEFRSQTEGLDQDQRRAKMMELMREFNESTVKSASEFLKPEQLTRLKQISYQQRGVLAFSDPEVEKKLNITDSQKTDFKAIADEFRTESSTVFQENRDDREAMMKKMGELRKSTLAKAEAKLNDEQQKTWKELLGDPFEIKFQPRPNN